MHWHRDGRAARLVVQPPAAEEDINDVKVHQRIGGCDLHGQEPRTPAVPSPDPFAQPFFSRSIVSPLARGSARPRPRELVPATLLFLPPATKLRGSARPRPVPSPRSTTTEGAVSLLLLAVAMGVRVKRISSPAAPARELSPLLDLPHFASTLPQVLASADGSNSHSRPSPPKFETKNTPDATETARVCLGARRRGGTAARMCVVAPRSSGL